MALAGAQRQSAWLPVMSCLQCIGVESLPVVRGLATHIVELEAEGAFGRFTFREDVAVSDENRKTGKLVAMAMIKSVRQLASTLIVAA